MKYFVVLLLTLFTAVLAQDLSCKAKFLDSFVSRIGFFGSMVNGTESNKGFFSIVGRYATARVYISDNMAASKHVVNSTFILYDGVTGEILSGGWVWSLCENGTLYRTGNVKGKRINCTTGTCPPVEPNSKLVSQLNTLYPIPGVPAKPGSASICTGAVNIDTDNSSAIINIVWRLAAIDYPIYGSTLSATQNTEFEIESFRKLTEEDRKDFTNVCKKTETKKSSEYSDLFDKIIGSLPGLF